MEFQARALLSISNAVENLQRPDAFGERAAPALFIDIFLQITRQGTHQFDFVRAVKFRQVFLPGFKNHGQIAAHHHAAALFADALDKSAKIRIQLRRAPQ